jgi:AcrR family transcriptional regulator
LLDAAEALLAERSVSGVTTRALAKQAHVSEGVLYNHFADKSDLLVGALVRRFSRLVERLDAAVPRAGDGDVRANLETLATRLVEFHADAVPLVRKLIGEPALLARFAVEIHGPGLPFGGRQIRDPLVAYLEAEQDAGRLGQFDVGAAADLLLATTAGLALVSEVAPIDLEPKLKAIVETMLGGLKGEQ